MTMKKLNASRFGKERLLTNSKLKTKNFFAITKAAYKSWWSKEPFRQSAVIAYYAIFSIPGLLVLLISIAGYFLGKDVVSQHLMDQITSTLGKDTAIQLENAINSTSAASISGWAKVLGVITIIIGATGVFSEFQRSLNLIWEVKPNKKKSRLWRLITVRLFSFGLIVSIAFILIVSLAVSALITAFSHWISMHFSSTFYIIIQIINFSTTIGILALLFALIFKFIPDAKIKWRYTIIGSLVTAVLFEIGKFALEIYFGKTNPGDGYGAGGSIILILLWVSYSSMIVYFGAEFTRAYANLHVSQIQPSDTGVEAKQEEKK